MKIPNRLTAYFVAFSVLSVGCSAPAFALEEMPNQLDFYQWVSNAESVLDVVLGYLSRGSAGPFTSSELAEAHATWVEAMTLPGYSKMYNTWKSGVWELHYAICCSVRNTV